jgi:hypothetical protein
MYLNNQIRTKAYHPNIIGCSYYVQNEKEIYGFEYKDFKPEIDFNEINIDLKSEFNTNDDFNFELGKFEDRGIMSDGIEYHNETSYNRFFRCVKYYFCSQCM